jgi:hypothetical protein
MFLGTGVRTRQVHASHTSARYKAYMRPCRIMQKFLLVLRCFWHSIFVRKICRQLQGYSEYGRYSLRSGIFFHGKEAMAVATGTATAINWVMATAMRLVVDTEGKGKGSKGIGNGNEGGRH